MRVPEELAVTGFDGFLDEKVPARALMTVKCPWEDAAAAALNLLLKRIEDRPEQGEATEVCLPVSLLAGDTA